MKGLGWETDVGAGGGRDNTRIKKVVVVALCICALCPYIDDCTYLSTIVVFGYIMPQLRDYRTVLPFDRHIFLKVLCSGCEMPHAKHGA